jgi:hypothetical protein
MKKLFRLLGFALLVLLIVAVAVFVYMDSIARRAIEVGETYALGVSATLDQADIGVFSGEFAMSGLKVSNPDGFSSPHFMRLDEGKVAVSLGSLRSDSVELTELQITGIDMNLEKAGGRANYDVILSHLKRFESNEPAAEQKQAEPGSEKKFMIRQIAIRNVMVHVDLMPVGGSVTKLNVPIDEVRLTNVGSDPDNAVKMSDLSGVLVKAIITAAINKAGKELPGEILGDLQGGLAQLQGMGDMGLNVIGDVTQGVQEGVGNAVEGIGDGVDKAFKGFGNLLGGDQKDKE